MPGEYKNAITIKEAIDAISYHDYLLPAIQRKFVWSSHQICVLFDSILRGYPINSFMMWEVNKSQIKNDYKFYGFLSTYCQRFKEENPLVPTNASFKNFQAIIDGQQRLTSLYIGLCGTYAYKQPRKWWPNTLDASILPPRKLYLDLGEEMKSEDDESLMRYNFKFLTDKQYENTTKDADSGQHWFCLHKILEMPQESSPSSALRNVVQPYLRNYGLADNEFAEETLSLLYEAIQSQPKIHYFNETSQDIDHVLDVFIRTNSGGTKLDFSDLLMSIAVAHWDGDFRQELDELIKQIHQSAEIGFYLERDWVLKTCLMLLGGEVRFRVKNFKADQVEKIQSNWPEIKACILETLRLVRRFGIGPQSLLSKNAVIPICYYLYKKQDDHRPLYKTINDLAKHSAQRNKISQWFYMALLKGVFGGQADTILTSMREVLELNISEPLFPLDQIIDRYKATNKDLRFDEEYINSMLNTQHGEPRCRALLHLLFPEMNVTEVFHIDHLHPKSSFHENELKKNDWLVRDEDLFDFYRDASHWNAIPNLHLLNDSQNQKKSASNLEEWIKDTDTTISKENLLVRDIDLGFESFPDFYNKRRTALKKRLEARVFVTAPMPAEPSPEDSDEEVVEDPEISA